MELPAGQFKARCGELISLVKEKRLEIIVTKRGKPVARLIPLPDDTSNGLWGLLRDLVTVIGDTTLPMADARGRRPRWRVRGQPNSYSTPIFGFDS